MDIVFLRIYMLAESFQSHLIKNLKVVWVFFSCRYVKKDITTAQKKGANHGSISLYLAPESDEWEEIECDEADQNIATNNHVCPHRQPGKLISLRYGFVKIFYVKYMIIF